MEELESRLEMLREEIRGVDDTQEPPRTTPKLLSVDREEAVWQAYLGYFLNPSELHGLDTKFLSEFLDMLDRQDAIPFSPSLRRADRASLISVDLERQSPDGNRPDLIVSYGSTWFLVIELKVKSGEGSSQTKRYAGDEEIVPGSTSSFEEGAYVYIAPDSALDSQSSEFVDVGWIDIAHLTRDIIADNSGILPTRTTIQLDEFATTITNNSTMTDIEERTQRKTELYFEYQNEIQSIESAVKPYVKKVLQQEWANKLSEEFRPVSSGDYVWRYEDVGNGYGQVRTPAFEDAREKSALDIHFEHKPTVDNFKQGQLRFRLELEEPDRSTITPDDGDRYDVFRKDTLNGLKRVESDHRTTAEETKIDVGQSDKKLYRAVYEYTPGEDEGYYEALSTALDEHTWIVDEVEQLLESKDYESIPLEV